jgi:hypothetical protein
MKVTRLALPLLALFGVSTGCGQFAPDDQS